MKPEIKQLLLTKLPEYQINKYSLRHGNCYCVLGVLCDLYRIETGQGEWVLSDDNPEDYRFVLGSFESLVDAPPLVTQWADLSFGEQNRLVTWNDVLYKNFRVLAYEIEHNL